jgi:hypothetical protein
MNGDIPLNRFGESVSLSDDGNILAVGIRGSAFEVGEVKIYRYNNGLWDMDETSIIGTERGEGFGASVALSGDGSTVVVGSPQNSLFHENAGIIAVHRYDETSKSWIQQGSLIGSTSTAELGLSVAISNDGIRVAGGAPTTAFDGSISRAGSVLVFDPDESQENGGT